MAKIAKKEKLAELLANKRIIRSLLSYLKIQKQVVKKKQQK